MGAEHRRPSVADVELGEDVLGVGADRLVRDAQLASYLRPVSSLSSNPNTWSSRWLKDSVAVCGERCFRVRCQGIRGGCVDAEQAPRLVVGGAIRLGVPQQAPHGSTFVQERPAVAIRFGRQLQGLGQGLASLLPVSLRVLDQRLKEADLEETSGALFDLG